jgi:hypothetical protein
MEPVQNQLEWFHTRLHLTTRSGISVWHHFVASGGAEKVERVVNSFDFGFLMLELANGKKGVL